LKVPLSELLKPTMTVHEAPGARFSGQLFTTVNGALVVMLET